MHHRLLLPKEIQATTAGTCLYVRWRGFSVLWSVETVGMPGALAQPEAEEPANAPFIFEPSSWVPRFRSVTPRTRFIDLPSDYLASLLTGAVYSGVEQEDGTGTVQTEIEWSDGSVDVIPVAAQQETSPSGTEAAIEGFIAELGGEVCPKFGRTCPTDATWANFHRSTKCTTADDVLTLLKSSERVMSRAEVGHGMTLALRKWADLDDRMEFRCFIRDDIVVGVAQRMVESSIEYEDDDMDRIVGQISSWFEVRVADRFDGPRSYVMDVYIDRSERVWIIDFAAWGSGTDALLFEWEELEHAPWMESQNRAQFRCACRHGAIRPSPRMYDGLPMELRNPEALASLAEAAQRLTREQNNDSGSEDCDDD